MFLCKFIALATFRERILLAIRSFYAKSKRNYLRPCLNIVSDWGGRAASLLDVDLTLTDTQIKGGLIDWRTEVLLPGGSRQMRTSSAHSFGGKYKFLSGGRRRAWSGFGRGLCRVSGSLFLIHHPLLSTVVLSFNPSSSQLQHILETLSHAVNSTFLLLWSIVLRL